MEQWIAHFKFDTFACDVTRSSPSAPAKRSVRGGRSPRRPPSRRTSTLPHMSWIDHILASHGRQGRRYLSHCPYVLPCSASSSRCVRAGLKNPASLPCREVLERWLRSDGASHECALRPGTADVTARFCRE